MSRDRLASMLQGTVAISGSGFKYQSRGMPFLRTIGPRRGLDSKADRKAEREREREREGETETERAREGERRRRGSL